MNNRIYIDNFNQINAYQPQDNEFSVCISQKLNVNQVQSLTNWMNGRCVTSLSLSRTGLNDIAVDWIAAAIRSDNVRLRRLTYINLSDNQIGDRGAMTLAAIARDIPYVRISLENNQIGSRGAVELVKDIAAGNSQSSVRLSGNRIDDQGARELSQKLARYRGRIDRLDLSHNPITLQGDREMARHLPQSINVSYRTEKISFAEWTDRHPYITGFLAIFLLPVLLMMACCQPQMEEPIQGLITPRSGPR